MNFSEVNSICKQWGKEIKETKKLSDKALLVITKDEDKLVLKVKRNEQATANENELLKFLNSNEIDVQYPLNNTYGETFVTHNDRNYCLYTFIEGETFSAKECLDNPKAPELLGKTMASLHKLMNGVTFSHFFPQKDLYKMVTSYAFPEILKVDNDEELKKIFQTFVEDLEERIEGLPKQLIHRDTHIFNFIFQDHKLSGVIDFEIAEVNVRIFDLCYCATSVLNEIFPDKNQRENWLQFVKGLFGSYNKANPLSEHEMNSIWHVMLCIQLIFMAFFSKNTPIYNVNKSMFIWIYKNYKKLYHVP